MTEANGGRCPACGDASGRRDSFDMAALRLARCGRCGLVFRTPLPAPEEVNALYQQAYYEHWGEFGPWAGVRAQKLATATRLLAQAGSYLSRADGGRPPRLLDVGCAHGFLLAAARERGFEAVGVEVARDGVAAARAQGFEVHAGELATVPWPAASFDVITAIDMIEHVRDPADLVRRMHALLVPGGSLVLVTPDVANIAARILRSRWPHYKPEHLLYFNAASLRSLLERQGFRVQRVMRARKVLTYAYIQGHFERYGTGLLRRVVLAGGRLLPPLLRNRAVALPSEMLVVARR